jgi:NAD(P)-dependent dehydrogenase (short-subunit alcohol dehydrogenase family)
MNIDIFRDDALAGKSILVTGGGSGLGKEISARSWAKAPSIFAGAVRKCSKRQRGRYRLRVASRSLFTSAISETRSGRGDDVGDLDGRPARRPRQQCGGQLHRADKDLSPAAFAP